MPLSMNDYNRLIKAGFTYYEITLFSAAKTPDGKDQPPIDLENPIWREALNTRHLWVNSMLEKGWIKERIKEEIENYYNRDNKRSPFDFIQAAYGEYTPAKKIDYTKAIKNRMRKAKDITGKLYNKRYKYKGGR